MSSKPDAPDRVERIVLVGFMGAGKSTVGRMLARRLGWSFVDLDSRVESEAGCTIAEIFAARGESAFRRLEDAVTNDLLGRRQTVLATGGGWPVQGDRMGRLPSGTFTVWLQVSAETAARRAARRPGLRPLLDVPDPLVRARELLAHREPEYRRADVHVRSDGSSPDDVVRAIVNALPDIERIENESSLGGITPPRSLN